MDGLNHRGHPRRSRRGLRGRGHHGGPLPRRHRRSPLPGADATIITDPQVEAAIAAVRAEQTPPE